MSQSVLLPPRLSGYAEELARAEEDIAGLESRLKVRPRDLEQRVRLLYRMFHRASLTGAMEFFEALGTATAEAIAEFGPIEDLCLLKANLDLRFHRLAEARQDLELAPLLPGRSEGRVVLADIDFQLGRYDEARSALEAVIAEKPTWDNLARLAYWESKLGDAKLADRLYEEAEEELTAKQMRSYSWLELQRGVLALQHGLYDGARLHYRRAEESYPGHWHTDEHLAELLAAEERFSEAEALFKQVIARVPKPELQQALGELYLLTGRAEEAQPWFDRALAAYLESVRRGGVHYFHHLADFYADAREVPAEAVRWARMDAAMRPNFSTQAALAWALHRNGDAFEAVQCIRLALASGARDAGIFSIAAAVLEAGGNSKEGRRYAQAALEINPRHGNFHMHH